MIQLNLLKEKYTQVFRQARIWAIKLLLVTLFLQAVIYWHLSSEAEKRKRGVTI
jgi:hypothetical protein